MASLSPVEGKGDVVAGWNWCSAAGLCGNVRIVEFDVLTGFTTTAGAILDRTSFRTFFRDCITAIMYHKIAMVKNSLLTSRIAGLGNFITWFKLLNNRKHFINVIFCRLDFYIQTSVSSRVHCM